MTRKDIQTNSPVQVAVENTASMPNKQTFPVWNGKDTTWVLSLFGTAIGAGVLFFPIRAGFGGLIPILCMLVLAFPIAYYCHRALTRLCFSGKKNKDGTFPDLTEVATEHFGSAGGKVITFLYFFAICPLLWIYGVTITNTFMNLWTDILGYGELNRALVAFCLLLLMTVVIYFGKELMVKVMSYLVFPFILCLIIVSVLLIPYWNNSVLTTVNAASFNPANIGLNVWLGIGIMVFSFNYSPIVSSFSVSQRERYEDKYGAEFALKRSSKIVCRAGLLMVAVVMFFAFSCLFTLSPEQMMVAKARNIPILSFLGEHFKNIASGSGSDSTLATFLVYAAPIIAMIAIFKSFFGHYLGTIEGLNGLVVKFKYKGEKPVHSTYKKVDKINMVLIMASTWLIAYLDPNILDLIELMGAPIIASLLCLLPVYAIYNVDNLKRFRGTPSTIFVTIIGILTIANIIRQLIM